MGPVLLADIARVTSTEERTATLTIFSAVRQLGLLVGKLKIPARLPLPANLKIWDFKKKKRKDLEIQCGKYTLWTGE